MARSDAWRRGRGVVLAAALTLLPGAVFGQGGAGAAAGPKAEEPTELPLPPDLVDLLAPTLEHPAVRAAAAGLAAAEAQLRAARSPVSLDLSSSVTRLDVDDIDVNPVLPGLQPLDRTLFDLSAAVALRPFAFGDIADLVDQREVGVEQAALELRSAVASVQARTLSAAYDLQLARSGLELAYRGLELARLALTVTEARQDRGAASARDLREALGAVADAELVVQDAEQGVELAAMALESLTPEAFPLTLPTVPTVPVAEGDVSEVVRAGLQARLAELGPRSAQRALLPTAQASYSFNLGEHDTLSVALESRTLQPSLSYRHQAQPRSFPETEIRGALTVGVAWSISSQSIDALEAAEAQLEAARYALMAARATAELQLAAAAGAIAAAERAVEAAERRLDAAQSRLSEVTARHEAGLTPNIEVGTERLAVARAEHELLRARTDLLDAVLDTYVLHATPLVAPEEK